MLYHFFLIQEDFMERRECEVYKRIFEICTCRKIQGEISNHNIINKCKVLFSVCVWKRGGLTGHYNKGAVH